MRAPEQLLDDPHLHDRGFWKEVEHPELGRSFTYPGEAAVYSGSPWRISRRAPLIGEHNIEIFCGEHRESRATDAPVPSLSPWRSLCAMVQAVWYATASSRCRNLAETPRFQAVWYATASSAAIAAI